VHSPEEFLSEEVRRELRRLPDLGGTARARVMTAVRAAAAGPRIRRRWHSGRAGWVSPVAGGLLAAGFLLAALGLQTDPRFSSPAAPTGAISSAIRDTLKLVRFALHAPAAGSVALVGDFNGWRRDALTLRRDSASGAWIAAVALAPGSHRYAFVIDDSIWSTDPLAPATVRDGRAVSRLVVPTP
jgi:hypothetical protein